MNKTLEPLVLFDEPDDACCESRGWVETTVTEDQARDILAPHCFDDDYEQPCRPDCGAGKRVWLRPEDEYAERWGPCEPNAYNSLEFWEIPTS